MFDAATALSLDILSSRISAPIYEYIFSYEAPFGMMKTMFQVEDGELQLPCCKKIIFAPTYITIHYITYRNTAV